MMNPNVKKVWVAALRGGDYKQGHAFLCKETPQGLEHCCLGVLCEVLHVRWVPTVADGGAGDVPVRAYEDCTRSLPSEVADRAGLMSTFGDLVVINGQKQELATHNDWGATFAQIADAIERQL